jgi:hypothetical protein
LNGEGLRQSIVSLVHKLMILGLSICTPALGVDRSCATNQVASKSRFPVVFKAPDWLFGVNVDFVEVWSFQGRAWKKITVQIDEIDSEGNFVLENGIPYTKYTDDGRLDAADEISIRGQDLGELKVMRVGSKPPGKFLKLGRVDFCDSSGSFFGSVWLAQKSTPTGKYNFKEIFDRETEEVNASSYRYRFRKNQPMLLGNVSLKSNIGEKTVFAGNSFIMPLLPQFFMFPSLYFGESDFTSEIESWRSGPIRTIVAVGARLRKFFSMLDLHLFSELVFYDNYFQIPTKIEFVFDPSKYLAKGSGIAYVLQYPNGLDWSLQSNLRSLPQGGPEVGGLKESAFDVSHEGIFLVRGKSSIGSFVARVRVDPGALKQSPPPYLASDLVFGSTPTAEAWPWLKQVDGDLGVFIEISGVKKGFYDFALDLAVSNQADDEFIDFKTLIPFWSAPVSF